MDDKLLYSYHVPFSRMVCFHRRYIYAEICIHLQRFLPPPPQVNVIVTAAGFILAMS